jgi:hypothetical protein
MMTACHPDPFREIIGDDEGQKSHKRLWAFLIVSASSATCRIVDRCHNLDLSVTRSERSNSQ